MDFPFPPQERITHDNVGKKYHRDTSANNNNNKIKPIIVFCFWTVEIKKKKQQKMAYFVEHFVFGFYG